MSITLSPTQASAVDSVAEWFNTPEDSRPQIFHLFGYAGTGKTTLAKYIVEALASEHKKFIYGFATFTGKASLVLKSKDCTPASTIHRLIYKPIIENGRIMGFRLDNESPLYKYHLLIIDEVSMVGEEIGRDLLSFNVPILVLGDPGQLPPIEGTGFFNPPSPEIMLEEIHRQARDNPIIHLATKVRLGEYIHKGNYGESSVTHPRFFAGSALDFDQAIVGRNRTRALWNSRVRQLLGKVSKIPEEDEKLICLKNNYSTNYINGQMCRIKSIQTEGPHLKLDLSDYDTDDALRSTYTHPNFFVGGEVHKKEWRVNLPFGSQAIDQFTYGYTITCHKSQGSQWDSVLISDESGVFREYARNWLYTAITRAADRVMILKG